MDYQTLLVHVDGGVHAAARFAYAADLARRCGAHLVGAAPTGISRHLLPSLPPEQDDATLALHLDMMREQARGALADFSAQCQASVLPSFEARLIDDEVGAGLALHARTADLVVLSQSEAERPALADMPPDVIIHSGRPVLVLPPALPAAAFARVVLAWDGGREAARALQLSLPLLRLAERVEIALFEPATGALGLADAMLADPRPWLLRHGISATLAVHRPGQHRLLSRRNEVGERLLAVAAGADLVVMGAYGHSRFREAILGGVTRTVLEGAAMPLLMAH